MKRLLSAVYRCLPAFLTRTLLYLFSAKFLHGAVIVVRDERGQVLVLRHVYRKGFPWGFPSGLLKADENASTGALRELKEETGLDAVVERIGPTELVAPRHLETVIFANAEAGGSLTLSHEIFEARWVEPGHLPDDVKNGLPPDQLHLIMSLA